MTARLGAALALLAGCASAADDGAGADGAPGGADGAAGPAPFVQQVLWTEHLGVLVGTQRAPFAPAGLIGTDLGVAFPIGGELAFLFGDSWTIDGNDWDRDSVAMASPVWPVGDELPALDWLTQPSGRFRPMVVPGVNLGGMNVPVDGVVVGGTTYVFFTTGYDLATGVHSHSVLAHTEGLAFDQMTVDHVVPSTKFLNVNVVLDGDDAYVFGSGPYRKSAVYLARVPVASLADREAWRYWQGGDSFGAGEASAVALVAESSVGEFSVRRHPTLELWLMTYQAASPRGVHLRTAPSAVGPWSEATLIWEPSHGYGAYMHQRPSVVGFDDGLGEPGREEDWGGEYGPYLVPEWFAGPPTPEGTYAIVYTLSTWNPYTVHLMRTVLGDPASGIGPPLEGVGLPPATVVNGSFASGDLAGWSASGDAFGVFVGADGQRRVTTYTTAEGNDATGQLWQDLVVDAGTSELRFQIHGGHAAVKLVYRGDVVRATRGREQNEPDLEVRWQLTEYRGETVRILIDDDQTGTWGFVGATGFELR